MSTTLQHHVPEPIRKKLGSQSPVCLLNGRDVFRFLAHESLIIMGCNARIPLVIPGIMRAAEELDAIVSFQLTRTEGGLDGGCTGQTPDSFFTTVVRFAEECRFSKPFILHADHVTVQDTSLTEKKDVRRLLADQLAAGFTSFALDASFNPLPDNISLVTELAQPLIAAGCGLEVELGEVKAVGAVSNLTTVAETEEFLEGLAAKGVSPHLLAIDNGSQSGNYLDGQVVKLDLERTGEIFAAARRFGLAGLVQHGITGTPLRIVGKLADYGIRKGNIGTLWQNVAHAGLPVELLDAMRAWARESGRDIKHATRVFKSQIDAIPTENARQIADMAYQEAKEFLSAFQATGSASRLARFLAEEPCGS
jgi:fructose-bisphosphate aldolase class II